MKRIIKVISELVRNWRQKKKTEYKLFQLKHRLETIQFNLTDKLETEESIIIFTSVESEFRKLLDKRKKRNSEENQAIIRFLER